MNYRSFSTKVLSYSLHPIYQGLTRKVFQHWGWVRISLSWNNRGWASPSEANSTIQIANMTFECLIFLLSVLLHWWKYIPNLKVSWSALIITFIKCTGFIYSILLSSDPLRLGKYKNITNITVILSSSKLENLKKNFEVRWGWNFSEAKSRVPRPRHSLPPTTHPD